MGDSKVYTLRTVKNAALQEGILSYAIKQARIQRDLCGLAQGLFKTPLEEMTTLDSVGSDGGEEGDVTGDIGDDKDSGDEELEGCNDDDDEDDI